MFRNQSRVFIGNLRGGVTEREIEHEFSRYGRLQKVWVARNPAGFAFVDYCDDLDAEKAIQRLNGLFGWKVEYRRQGKREVAAVNRSATNHTYFRRRAHQFRSDSRCYECGKRGHIARNCVYRNCYRQQRYRFKGRFNTGSYRKNYRRRSRSRSRSRSPSISTDDTRQRRRSSSRRYKRGSTVSSESSRDKKYSGRSTSVSSTTSGSSFDTENNNEISSRMKSRSSTSSNSFDMEKIITQERKESELRNSSSDQNSQNNNNN